MEDVMHDMSLEAIVEAIEGNLFALFKSFDAIPGAAIYDEDDALRYVTGLGSPMFNGVARAHFGASGDLGEKIEETLSHFKERGLPMFWWTGPATQPMDLDEQLQEYGLEPNFVAVPGMAVELSLLTESVSPLPDLKIERVEDAEALVEWGRTFNRSYGVPDFAGDAWVSACTSVGLGSGLPWTLYIGRLNGEPVAVSILFLGAGVAGLYGIGTVPEARGQGIGKAITLAPLLEAREIGYHVGILHTSDMADNMYRSIGFKEYCFINRYVMAK